MIIGFSPKSTYSHKGKGLNYTNSYFRYTNGQKYGVKKLNRPKSLLVPQTGLSVKSFKAALILPVLLTRI